MQVRGFAYASGNSHAKNICDHPDYCQCIVAAPGGGAKRSCMPWNTAGSLLLFAKAATQPRAMIHGRFGFQKYMLSAASRRSVECN